MCYGYGEVWVAIGVNTRVEFIQLKLGVKLRYMVSSGDGYVWAFICCITMS